MRNVTARRAAVTICACDSILRIFPPTSPRCIGSSPAERETREGELAAAKAGLLAKAPQIEKLKLQIAGLRRAQFGRSSEKMERTISSS